MKGQIILVVCLGLYLLSGTVNAQCRPCMGCGNGRCETGENCNSCPVDCGICPSCTQRCGNNICELGETTCNCPADCGACCLDGVCREDKGETSVNCPADCAVNITGTVVNAETRALLPGSQVTCTLGSTTTMSMNSTNGTFSFLGVQGSRYLCTAQNTPNYFPNSTYVVVYPMTGCATVVIPLQYNYGCIGGSAYNLVTLQPLSAATVQCNSTNLSTPVHFTGVMGQYWFDRLTPGTYTCRAQLATFADGVANVTVGNGGDCEHLDLYLRPLPGAIQGYVIDASGNILSSVAITCFIQTNDLLRNSTTTSATGYQLLNFNTGQAACSASLATYISQTKVGYVPSGGVLVLNFTLALLPASLSGIVSDSVTNLPIVGAAVYCMQTTVLAASAMSQGGSTNTNGSYVFNPISPATYNCTASSTQYYSSASAMVTLGPGQNLVQNFALVPLPSMINVKVIDTSSNSINGASVQCSFSTAGQTGPLSATTNSTGDIPAFIFSLQVGLTTVGYTCTASAAGYGAGASPSQVIARGQTASLVIQLVNLGIRVTVMESYSNGSIPNLSVGALVTCTSALPSSYSSTTGTSGMVLYSGAAPSVYTCTASKAGFTNSSTSVTIITTSGVVNITLNISLVTYLIQGYVIRLDKPVELPASTYTLMAINRATGQILYNQSPNGTQFAGHTQAYSFNSTLPVNVSYVASGTTILTTVYNVSYTLANYNVGGRNPTVIQVAVTSSIIQGYVTTATNASVVSLNVAAVSTSSGQVSQGTVNAATGFYQILNLQAGTYLVTFTASGYSTYNATVVISDLGLVIVQNALLVLPTNGTVIGTVSVGSTLLGGVTLTLTYAAAGSPVLTTTSLSNGQYSFPVVPAGSFSITASTTGYNSATTTGSVNAGNTQTINFVLTLRGGTIQGNLFYQTTKAPITLSIVVCAYKYTAGVTIAPTGTACPNSASSVLATSGNYQMTNVPEGQYLLYAAPSVIGSVNTFLSTSPITVSQSTPVNYDIYMTTP